MRMVDKSLNERFLQRQDAWDSFIKEAFSLAKQNNFSEIAFDIELSLFQDNLRRLLNEFLAKAKEESEKTGIKISFIAYADSFYRKRPFDFEQISKLVNQVYLMAYDFTKSISEPGPNFPLNKGEWGYSLLQAVEDFSQYFPKEKITVIFGMYGRDWAVGLDGKPLGKAKVLTLNQIKKKYLQICTPERCVKNFDKIAGEKELNIVFSKRKEGKELVYPRAVWYEDEESTEFKKKVLKEKGISSFCYFALGYY